MPAASSLHTFARARSKALDATTPRTVADVPFLDLRHVHEGLSERILEDIASLISTNAYTNGPAVAAFEAAYAAYCGRAHCVGTASGLDALRLALVAAGIVPGDEVLVPAQTFIATFEAVTQAGGTPVPVEIGDSDYAMDPDAAAAATTPSTRFIVPVHLYGQMADMSRLSALATRDGLGIVEDACQAHGASRAGVVPGDVSVAAAFSFYPGKNLGAIGDAGALTTDDAQLAARVRALREHGQTRKYHHEYEGYTARLDTIQAAVLLRKLPRLDAWNDGRRWAARFYAEALAGLGDLVLPPVADGSAPVWHLFVVRTKQRAALEAYLAGRRIATGRHYPVPPHLSPAYSQLGYQRGAFPRAEALADEALSLPLFPGISRVQLEAVVEAVTDFFDRG
jgi:dTDP-4-amino-4,6-dideoxygalactose transaminase